MNKVNPLEIWKKSHWIFSAYIQSLIICLLRLEMELNAGNLTNVAIEMETATELILGSAAAMELAAYFNKQQYETEVRPLMTPPHVKSEEFSGLMHWDHAYLIAVLKRIQPLYKTLPASLKNHHEKFMGAYKILFNSHKGICQKFGGNEQGSLRSTEHTAIDVLDKFERNRLRLVSGSNSGKNMVG
jgi:hypothetical protein